MSQEQRHELTSSQILYHRISTMGWPPFNREVGRLLIEVLEIAEQMESDWHMPVLTERLTALGISLHRSSLEEAWHTHYSPSEQ